MDAPCGPLSLSLLYLCDALAQFTPAWSESLWRQLSMPSVNTVFSEEIGAYIDLQ